MINEWILYAAMTALGVGLGVFFYAGLYFTTKKGLTSDQPALWFTLSALTRISITLLVFYLIAGDDWKRLIMCVVGFIISKPLVIRFTKELDHFPRLSNIVENETK